MKHNRPSLSNPVANKNRIQKTDLAPDGVRILIDWDKFVIGSSVFVPAINSPELVAQFYDAANPEWQIAHRTRVENGRWGVRFWRIL